MKFTLNTLGCPEWTLERVAEAVDAYGYDGVDLRLLDGEIVTPALLRANRDRLARLFPPASRPIVVLGTSARFSAADAGERAANEALTREYLRLAGELGIPVVRVFGGARPEGSEAEQQDAHVATSLAALAPAAEAAGVTLALETHDDFSSAARVAGVLARVQSAAVGAIWDMHHTYRAGERPADVWRLLGDRIVNVHVKDARRRNDGSWELLLMGEGELPIEDGLRVLLANGYADYVSVEWEKAWHPELPDPAVAYPQHLRVLRPMVERLTGQR